jgi:guanosine-3',5'-bis(diphosphate) 3'-pyrophosphohydrolase
LIISYCTNMNTGIDVAISRPEALQLLETFPAEREQLLAAIAFAEQAHHGQRRRSGEPFIVHPLTVGVILAEQGLSADTVIAGLLHDVIEDSAATREAVAEAFGDEIAHLVEGLTKMVQLAPRGTPRREKAATYRKLLLASADDARVLVIKLADRLHNIRTINAMPTNRAQAIARETLEVYAPLAHRLGMSKIKEELEDRSLSVLDHRAWEEAELIQTERVGASGPMLTVIGEKLVEQLAADSITSEVTTRVKSRWSISEKVRRRGGASDEIWDVLGIRILVTTVDECYRALGSIHALYPPRFDRFHDYIAVPKANLYQSLHTTVIVDDGSSVEIQIRTYEMHQIAEHGIAAHWLYKETLRGGGPRSTQHFLAETAASQRSAPSMEEAFDALRSDVFEDEIYVFTPEGDVKVLPLGACAIDFAYAVHTDVGHRCVGSRVDGVLKPITRPLKNGEVVEIIVSKNTTPSRDWIDVVATSRARNKIRQFHQAELEHEQVAKGFRLIGIELKKAGLGPLTRGDQLAETLIEAGYDSPEKAALEAAKDEHRIEVIVRRIVKSLARQPPSQTGPVTEELPLPRQPVTAGNEYGVLVDGEGGLMIRLAHCCSPEPGDEIIGYVSMNRGVSIHRGDCRNMQSAITAGSPRIKQANWDRSAYHSFRTEVEMVFLDRPGLTGDISGNIVDLGAEMIEITLRKEGKVARGVLVCLVASHEQSTALRDRLATLPGALKINRRGHEDAK